MTRLAPSPTGALHLGNVFMFLANWLVARDQHWKIIMRMEDLDGPRIKAGASAQTLTTLTRLGFTWDEGPIYQSARTTIYREAIEALLASGEAYPCVCSRSQVQRVSSAPHAEDGADVYPGTCRGRFASVAEARTQGGVDPSIRLTMPAGPVQYDDMFLGSQERDGAALGDFVIAGKSGSVAYQVAAAVDDAAMGVSRIVRGRDLVDSVFRQERIRQVLGLAPSPKYWHLPLVVGQDGRRLAKRHGDTRVEHYLAGGVRPERILGLMAFWLGILEQRVEIGLGELLGRLDLRRLSREDRVFTPEDEAFLAARKVCA